MFRGENPICICGQKEGRKIAHKSLLQMGAAVNYIEGTSVYVLTSIENHVDLKNVIFMTSYTLDVCLTSPFYDDFRKKNAKKR